VGVSQTAVTLSQEYRPFCDNGGADGETQQDAIQGMSSAAQRNISLEDRRTKRMGSYLRHKPATFDSVWPGAVACRWRGRRSGVGAVRLPGPSSLLL
jgi:hypothetical protein